MKAPTKSPAKKPTVKKPVPKKGDSGFSVNQALDLANTSVDAMRAYADFKKEAEATKRAQIDGQKEIILGEQNLEKARMEHGARLVELDNSDKDSLRRHEEAMTNLARKDRELGIQETLQDRVLAQLEAKELTAEEAALLLYGAQE
ncbi:hypothetical protein ACM760_19105 [Pseudomonas aeruginosa]|jgi:vacuolar-type H+-ATPase subunit I/STV1|uniref:hypothetical protein n=1 Tax=Pseudomonas aeruginosa TaxID=287 RepID=UPI0003B9A355|nr:hypothetical protein [Pseudomonas aeruginosa]ERV90336.1 hypothetical protein Q039_03707 [Pseudomonas aeruginosa BWHPSA026]ETU71224.1 hypothetical protein Q095_06287 [Pseudomonas aeruginosa PS50]ETV16605.1 hypothetical protein Q048_06109 [Pseudomonas aeruginosa BWHPSA043]KHE33300.1 hypothetical protein LH31_20310 [Pseudomonas aeruginosa]KRU56421.1 hypothetical protein AN450_29100 [Pseudomonas aeruginosa]